MLWKTQCNSVYQAIHKLRLWRWFESFAGTFMCQMTIFRKKKILVIHFPFLACPRPKITWPFTIYIWPSSEYVDAFKTMRQGNSIQKQQKDTSGYYPSSWKDSEGFIIPLACFQDPSSLQPIFIKPFFLSSSPPWHHESPLALMRSSGGMGKLTWHARMLEQRKWTVLLERSCLGCPCYC